LLNKNLKLISLHNLYDYWFVRYNEYKTINIIYKIYLSMSKNRTSYDLR